MLAFDAHAFAGRKAFNKSQGIVASEELMQMGRIAAPSKSSRWIPAFASNTPQLQAVLLHAAVRYIFRDKEPPQGFIADLETVVALAKEKHATLRARAENSSKLIQQRMYQHLLCVEDAGGYVAFISAIAYRCWRLRWPGPVVAQGLGVNALLVQTMMEMLADYAEHLGFDTYPQHSRKGKIFVNEDRIGALWAQTHSVAKIHELLGHDTGTIRAVLRRLGFHNPAPYKLDVDGIVSLWKQGRGVGQIVKQVHHSEATVIRVLKAHRLYVKNRKPGGWHKPRPAAYRQRSAPVTAAQRAARNWYAKNRTEILDAQKLGITVSELRKVQSWES
jgi:hypothetical protein